LRAQQLLFLFNTSQPGTDDERRAMLVGSAQSTVPL
jgi:hypothetical protein